MKSILSFIILILLSTPGIHAREQPNFLLITVDDMNWDSPGYSGGVARNITPNLDQLAAEGRYFSKAHVTVAVCQPSRQSMLTGLYPPNNGALGFFPIREDVPTLTGILSEHGYFNAIFGKIGHMTPVKQFAWDMVERDLDNKRYYLSLGRDPDFAYQATKTYIRHAQEDGKPFFINANALDPHRPFHDSDEERNRFKDVLDEYPDPSHSYATGEVAVPAFLPDLPEIREEMAQYASSVRRADDVVGATLRALKESGEEENTIVIFLSDNGMPFPFGKWDVYINSTRTPLLIRWPGKIEPGIDDEHYITAVDLMPTILEYAGIKTTYELDGRSMVRLLEDEQVDDWRDFVVTAHYEAILYGFALKNIARDQGKSLAEVHRTYQEHGWELRPDHSNEGTMSLPINKRAIHVNGFLYIYNPWVVLNMENRREGGPSLNAMIANAQKNADIKKRLEFYLTRVPEELYHLEKDPHSLNNLIDDPAFEDELQTARRTLLEWMQDSKDPNADEFSDFMAIGKPE